MMVRISNPWLLGYVFGWSNEAANSGGGPVGASPRLWWLWFRDAERKAWWNA